VADTTTQPGNTMNSQHTNSRRTSALMTTDPRRSPHRGSRQRTRPDIRHGVHGLLFGLALLFAAPGTALAQLKAPEQPQAQAQAQAPGGPSQACPPLAQPPTDAELARARTSDRGIMWRIERDGHHSYLYGTIHVGKPDWAFLGPKVMQALRDSDTLALEVDLSDPKVAGGNLGEGSMPMPQAVRARMARQFESACVEAEVLEHLHPVMQAVTLTVLAGRRDGFDPAFAQEFVLIGAARALDRSVVSLETPELQMRLLIPQDAATGTARVERMLDQLERDRVGPVLSRLATAWERGDLQTLESYERWCECAVTADDRALLTSLNDQRNPGLADGIDKLHRAGQSVFAAVGALHMSGAQALPRLMAERGYKVERVPLGR
jgi:uncharacterized protein YbaP (TraB family)